MIRIFISYFFWMMSFSSKKNFNLLYWLNQVVLIFTLQVVRFRTIICSHIIKSGYIVVGNETITDGLRQPIEMCDPQNRDFCTIKQNLTRVLQASDDKKILRCAANHISLKGKELYADFKINVNCKYDWLIPCILFLIIR